MKRLSTIAAMILSLGSFGQDNFKPKVSSDFNRLLFGVNISSDCCYRTLSQNDGSDVVLFITNSRNKREAAKMGYTAGFNICYNISGNFGIESGVQYTNKGYSSKTFDLTFGDLIGPRYGFVYPTNSSNLPAKVKFIYNYIYLDVPVRAVFNFWKGKLRYIASIGVAANILLKATQTTCFEFENGDQKHQTKDQPYDFKTLNISPSISAGIEYSFSKKISLRVEPTFRYGLLQIIDATITEYLWNTGLNITGYYVLK